MTRAVGYVRVSTGHQAEEGQSIETQRARLTAYALAQGMTLVGIVEETGSGATVTERPGLQHVLSTLARDADVLLVVRLDRLTRSIVDLRKMLDEQLKGRGLVSLTEHLDTTSASGRMLMSLITVFSEWEREAISERTRSVLTHKRSRNERTGTIPYGKRLVGDGPYLEDDPEELATIAQARSLRARGLSLRAVSGVLERRGRLARGGRPFEATMIRRMCMGVMQPTRGTETGGTPSMAPTST